MDNVDFALGLIEQAIKDFRDGENKSLNSTFMGREKDQVAYNRRGEARFCVNRESPDSTSFTEADLVNGFKVEKANLSTLNRYVFTVTENSMLSTSDNTKLINADKLSHHVTQALIQIGR